MKIHQIEREILDFIKKNNLAEGKVLECRLYPNGFSFKTAKQGWKIYDFKGNDLIGDKADGKVLECDLYSNSIAFRTKKQGWGAYF